MDDFQSKLNSIMGNPAMMEQIMNMAKMMNQSPSTAAEPAAAPTSQQSAAASGSQNVSSFPELDFSMIQKLSGIAASSGMDQNQKTLLNALKPYLPSQRLEKLEKAMRAVKLARFASSSLGHLNFTSSFGR